MTESYVKCGRDYNTNAKNMSQISTAQSCTAQALQQVGNATAHSLTKTQYQS